MLPTTLVVDNKTVAAAAVAVMVVVLVTHHLTRFIADRGSNSWEKFQKYGLTPCNSVTLTGDARRKKGKFFFDVVTDTGEAIKCIWHPMRRQLRHDDGQKNKLRKWVRKSSDSTRIGGFFSKARLVVLSEVIATHSPVGPENSSPVMTAQATPTMVGWYDEEKPSESATAVLSQEELARVVKPQLEDPIDSPMGADQTAVTQRTA